MQLYEDPRLQLLVEAYTDTLLITWARSS
jgi:hypothetical protein